MKPLIIALVLTILAVTVFTVVNLIAHGYIAFA
jgi:hypothetical protein